MIHMSEEELQKSVEYTKYLFKTIWNADPPKDRNLVLVQCKWLSAANGFQIDWENMAKTKEVSLYDMSGNQKEFNKLCNNSLNFLKLW